MFRRNVLGVIAACVAFAAGGAGIHPSGGHRHTLTFGVGDPNSVALFSPRDNDRNRGWR